MKPSTASRGDFKCFVQFLGSVLSSGRLEKVASTLPFFMLNRVVDYMTRICLQLVKEGDMRDRRAMIIKILDHGKI